MSKRELRNESMEKIGLVLEGGGVKGAYQVGALRAIEEYREPYREDRVRLSYHPTH